MTTKTHGCAALSGGLSLLVQNWRRRAVSTHAGGKACPSSLGAQIVVNSRPVRKVHEPKHSEGPPPLQEKSFPIGNDESLEALIANFLMRRLESKSYGKLADELGISKSTLSRYANAKQSMTLSALQKIQTALGISIEEIFGKDAVRKPRA